MIEMRAPDGTRLALHDFGGAGRVVAAGAVRLRAVRIAGAGHDVHLDSPQQWREALTGFLS
ncbi:hypothetical protein [Couchioplanes caeruleus]|nr:hypothetical protein [Couchioplanes caeruleus]